MSEQALTFALITCSDTRSMKEDTAGTALEALIAEKHPKYFHALANAATAAMQADAEAAMDMFSMVPSA